MVGIQGGTVDDLLPETIVQPLKSPSPRLVIIEKAFYPLIALQGFHRLLHVRDGIKYKPVRSDDAELHSREVIHKALEYGTCVRAVTLQGNLFRRYAAPEEAVAKLQSFCIVTEADGIVPFAMHTIPHLLAVGYGNVALIPRSSRYSSSLVSCNGRTPISSKTGAFSSFLCGGGHNGMRTCSALCDESRPQEEVLTPDKLSCQVEDVPTFADAKVKPHVFIRIDLKRRCPLRAVRSGMPQGVSFLFGRMNPIAFRKSTMGISLICRTSISHLSLGRKRK